MVKNQGESPGSGRTRDNRKICITDIYKPGAKFLVYDINEHFAPVAEYVPYGDFSKLSACNVVLNASGLGMSLYQGAAQIELWTGKKAPVEAMRQELLKIVAEQQAKEREQFNDARG